MLGGMMVDEFWFEVIKDAYQGCFIGDIGPIKASFGIDVGRLSTTFFPQIIDNGDLMLFSKIVIGNMGADEACSASNQDTHSSDLSCVCVRS
jgi:hypothetical protein